MSTGPNKPRERTWPIRLFWLVAVSGLVYVFTTGQVDEALFQQLLEVVNELSN